MDEAKGIQWKKQKGYTEWTTQKGYTGNAKLR